MLLLCSTKQTGQCISGERTGVLVPAHMAVDVFGGQRQAGWVALKLYYWQANNAPPVC
jgi:hypothetical protein